MTGDQFVTFIEGKLEEHGVTKVIPDEELLGEAYRLFRRGQRIEKIIEEALAEDAGESDFEAPGDLPRECGTISPSIRNSAGTTP